MLNSLFFIMEFSEKVTASLSIFFTLLSCVLPVSIWADGGADSSETNSKPAGFYQEGGAEQMLGVTHSPFKPDSDEATKEGKTRLQIENERAAQNIFPNNGENRNDYGPGVNPLIH